MRKIYEAFGKDKRIIIEDNNDYRAACKYIYSKDQIGIEDFAMIGSINKENLSKNVDINWYLNGLLPEKNEIEDITIIEPLSEHFDKKLETLNEINTTFSDKITLSKNAIILMSVNLYEELIKDSKYKNILNKFNVRLYEGEKDLALKMVFLDKDYIYLYIDKNGYILNEEKHPDLIEYNKYMINKKQELLKTLDKDKKKSNKKKEKLEIKEVEDEKNCKMISGLTKEVEGDLILDTEIQGATDIGKTKENQEDAILLIKDEDFPEFKMMVVADGLGGCDLGEVASHVVINDLKTWFKNFSYLQKESYYTKIENIKENLIDEIRIKIQKHVQEETLYKGATTLVCAIIGKKNTLVANIGDSRAYIVKNGKLLQVSREDTMANENLEEGKSPTKEVARFDISSNIVTQCIGMNSRNLIEPNVTIINNKDYDMLLLFTDGVTDCLSDEDIAVACKTTDKKELANKIVEKAIKHDSILDENIADYYNHLTPYIPGGKDNTTAVVYIHKDGEERE